MTETPKRAHHATSPSTLQAREVCTHYEPDSFESEKAKAGTRQHDAVEHESLDNLPTDEECEAVQMVIDFVRSIRDQFAETAKKLKTKFTELNETYLHVDDKDTSAGYFDKAFVLVDHAVVIDYKFGEWAVEPVENNLQAYCYVLGIFRAYPKVKTVTFYFLMPYQDTIESHKFTRADAPEMLLRVQTVVARSKAKAGKPTPCFLACFGCKNKATCSALAEYAIQISEKFAPMKLPKEVDPMKIVDPEDAVAGFQVAKIMEGWAASYKSRCSNLAVENEDFIPPGYILISSADRVINNSRAAFDILKSRFKMSESQLWETIRLSVGAIENVAKKSVPKGQKTAHANDVMEALNEAGLVDKGDQKVYLRARTDKKQVTE